MSELLTGLADPTCAEHTLRFPDGEFTFAEFALAAAAVAGDLAGRSRVAVFAEPTRTTALAVVGALLAGVSVIPVPTDSGPRELAYLIEDSGAEAWLGAAGDASLPSIAIDPAARGSLLPAEPDPARIAMILYTSGTTGSPKGVLIPRSAVAACLDGLIDAWDWTSADTLAHGLPLFHVHGLVLGLLGPLRVGSSLVHTGRPTPQAYAEAAATMYFGVPTVWSRIAADHDAARALSGARLLISGSAPLPVPVFRAIAELTGQEPVERYGMSETLITISARADGPRLPGHVGFPIAGVETRLRDDAGEPVPHDGETIGNLQVSGPTVLVGYLNRPEATAEAFTDDGWFRTGDLATIDATGNHRIVGRASVDLIKSGGFRIGAGEIESVLLAHPGVRECAVVGAPDPDLGQRVVAYVVAADPSPEPAELIDLVAAELNNHKRPRDIRFVEELPRNAMGKVQKKLLLDQ